MNRALLTFCTLTFLSAVAVLGHRLVTAMPPSNSIQMMGPDGPVEYFTCQGPAVQIKARGDRVWMPCDLDGDWLAELDYASGKGRLLQRLPGRARMIHEDPTGGRLAIGLSDALLVYDIDTDTLTTIAEGSSIQDVGWMNGRPWAVGGYSHLRLYTPEGAQTLMRIEPPAGRDFDMLAVDRQADRWRVFVFSRPEGRDGPGQLLMTHDAQDYTQLAQVAPTQLDGKPRIYAPKVLVGAAKHDFFFGMLVEDAQGWPIHTPSQTPPDTHWRADRHHTPDGTRWISYSADSTQHLVVARVHDRWAYLGTMRGSVGWTPETIHDVMRRRHAPVLRPLGDGYVLTNGLNRDFARLNADLERMDGRGWVGRIVYLYSPAGWSASGIKRSAWRALVLPWVLLGFPLLCLLAVRTRRNGPLVVWLIGAAICAMPYWEMVRIV